MSPFPHDHAMFDNDSTGLAPTCNLTTSTPAHTRLGDRLDAEWAVLRTSRRACRRARSWRSATGEHPLDRVLEHALADHPADLEAIVTATHRSPDRHDTDRHDTDQHGPEQCSAIGDDDAILVRLVTIARTDDLACRVIVQRLLPALVHGARRYSRPGPHGRPNDTMEVAVPALCLAIHAYDVERRTRHVAASLVSDAIFQAFRRPLRRKSSTELLRSPLHFGHMAHDVAVDEVSPFEALAAVVRDARLRGVAEHDLDLIRALAADRPSVVAADRNVTARTIRTHRDRAVTNIRVALGIAA